MNGTVWYDKPLSIWTGVKKAFLMKDPSQQNFQRPNESVAYSIVGQKFSQDYACCTISMKFSCADGDDHPIATIFAQLFCWLQDSNYLRTTHEDLQQPHIDCISTSPDWNAYTWKPCRSRATPKTMAMLGSVSAHLPEFRTLHRSRPPTSTISCF